MGFKIEQLGQWFRSSNLGQEQGELSKFVKKSKIWAEKYDQYHNWVPPPPFLF